MSLDRISLDGIILIPSSLLMLLSVLCKFINPEVLPLYALIGLVFPFALFTFAIGLVLRVSRGYWKGLVWPLIILTCSFFDLQKTVGGIASDAGILNENSFSATSFNVRRMDEYNWLEGDLTRKDLWKWLGENDSEILCLQEFPSKMKGQLSKTLGNYSVFTSGQTSGTAIATSFQVIDKGMWVVSGEETTRGVFVDVIIGSDTLRVLNVHLQSVGLVSDDYDAVRDGTDSEDRKRLISRLSRAYSLRAKQARELNENISISPYEVLLAGDFNDTPVSYAVNAIENMHDAFTVAGLGLGATYVGDLKGLRIDYLMYTDGLSAVDFTTCNINLSDHRPITAQFNF